MFVHTHDRASLASSVLVAAFTTRHHWYPMASVWSLQKRATAYPSSCFPHVTPIYRQKGPIEFGGTGVKDHRQCKRPTTRKGTHSKHILCDGVDSTIIKRSTHRPPALTPSFAEPPDRLLLQQLRLLVRLLTWRLLRCCSWYSC